MKRTNKAPGVRLADQMQAFSFLEHVAVSLSKQTTFDRDSFISDLRVTLSGANRKASFEQLAQYLSRQLGIPESQARAEIGITHVELKNDSDLPDVEVKEVEPEPAVLTT